jgi:hypothetical protein
MRAKSKGEKVDELRPEYDLARLLRNGVQGKYADRYREGTNLVLLAPDVAKAFPTEEAVNEALRLVIQLTKLPAGGKRAAAKA